MKNSKQSSIVPVKTMPAHIAATRTQWPSVEQLAHIAATLAMRSTSGQVNIDAEKLACDAFDLWAACGKEIRERWELAAIPRPPEPELPEPKSYPVSLDEFLGLALPKKRPEDRMKIYREYLREMIPFGQWMNAQYPNKSVGSAVTVPRENYPPLTDNQVAEAIKNKRERKFDKWQFESATRQLLDWVPTYEQRNRTEKAKKGSQKRWHSPKRKKSKLSLASNSGCHFLNQA